MRNMEEKVTQNVMEKELWATEPLQQNGPNVQSRISLDITTQKIGEKPVWRVIDIE